MAIDLDAIRDRACAATPGPWDIRYGGVSAGDEGFGIASRYGNPRIVAECWPCTTNLALREQLLADAQFISASRTDIPALCDEVERLRNQLTAVRNEYRQQSIAEMACMLPEFTSLPEDEAVKAARLSYDAETRRMVEGE